MIVQVVEDEGGVVRKENGRIYTEMLAKQRADAAAAHRQPPPPLQKYTLKLETKKNQNPRADLVNVLAEALSLRRCDKQQFI
jgi:hypothetical protein